MDLPTSGLYAAKAAALTTAIALIVVSRWRIDRHLEAVQRFGPANAVTSVRALLTAAIAALTGEPITPAVAGAAAVAGAIVLSLDGVDGWLARRTRMTSAFGARYDMEVDALLIQALAILAWTHGKAGAWVVLSGLLRYLFVAAGWIWPWMNRALFPSLRRKTICVAQIAGLLVALWPDVRPPLSNAAAALALAALSYSFLVDTLWLWRHRFA